MMRAGIHVSFLVLMPVWMACQSPLSLAAAPVCEEVYFAPADFNHAHPLGKPDAEFTKSYSLAQAGNAMEQRNIAVSYDAGYLVEACPGKARYWYRKAAASGDPVAQKWVEQDSRFSKMLDGPEFALMDRSSSPQLQTQASAAPGAGIAAGTKVAVAQPAGARTAGQMLADVADITRPPDQSSDTGKMIQIGRLMGSMISHK